MRNMRGGGLFFVITATIVMVHASFAKDLSFWKDALLGIYMCVGCMMLMKRRD